MAKSRIGTIDRNFREKIVPVFLSWGLKRHPRQSSSFGRDYFGFAYDFADSSDVLNVKLCSFYIFAKDSSLAIDAAKGFKLDSSSIPPALNTPTTIKTFRLAKRLTPWRLLNPLKGVAFMLEQRKNESVDLAADRLIDEVVGELPRLKKYLYG